MSFATLNPRTPDWPTASRKSNLPHCRQPSDERLNADDTPSPDMKTAYELAMERLNKSAPAVNLNDEQKRELAELDSRYAAKLAERELTLQAEIAKAEAAGDWDALQKWQQQLATERKALQVELAEKKEQVRQRKS
jgi:hypothetical protein